jgi:hypothetical protein
MTWKRLRHVYEEDGVVLVLGSGVSLCSGLPNWENLLQRLLANCPNAGQNLFRELLAFITSTAFSALITTRAILQKSLLKKTSS